MSKRMSICCCWCCWRSAIWFAFECTAAVKTHIQIWYSANNNNSNNTQTQLIIICCHHRLCVCVASLNLFLQLFCLVLSVCVIVGKIVTTNKLHKTTTAATSKLRESANNANSSIITVSASQTQQILFFISHSQNETDIITCDHKSNCFLCSTGCSYCTVTVFRSSVVVSFCCCCVTFCIFQ